MRAAPSRSAWPALSLVLCSEWTMATTFDSETLRLRGIDPGLAAYLAQAARFTEGVHAVRLWVNGQPKGIVNARFDANGGLCIDQSMREAGALVDAPGGCSTFAEQFPHTHIELLPQLGEVKLLVPDHALRVVPTDLAAFTRGGVAGVLNYELQGLHNQFEGQRSTFASANTEAGINAGEWILRSRQLYSRVQGKASVQHLEAFAQRTFSQYQAQLQLGQINLNNPVLAGARVTGVQWLSEPALDLGARMAQVHGIAATQARVDLRQGGVLIYSTVVAAGPFELNDIPQLDRRRDVEVTVIEVDGQRHTFSVLAAALGLDLPSRSFSLGLGQLRDSPAGEPRPWVLSTGISRPLSPTTSLNGGTLLAQDYSAAGAGLSLVPWSGSRVQGLLQAAHASPSASNGLQASLTLNQQLNPQWSALLSAARQSLGYRDLLDVGTPRTTDQRNRLRDQHALGLTWAHSWLGSLSGAYSTTTSFAGARTARAQLNWGRRLGPAAVTATGQWQTAGDGGRGNALYLSASLPLGDGVSWRSTARRGRRGVRLGSGVQGQWDERSQYRLGAERSGSDGVLSYNAGMSRITQTSQLDAGYAQYGRGNHGYSGAARGALLLHQDGLTSSPYPLQDTFGLVSLEGVPNVRIHTPGGTVWTDRHGRAVLPQLAPFGRSNVQVATASLPRNVDIEQGSAVIQAARGAVPRIDFAVRMTRRVLLQVYDELGRPLKPGAGVTNQQGLLITLVQQDGAVFVPNVYTHPRLWSRTIDDQPCELHFQLPTSADEQVYFETTTAQCHTALRGMS